MKSKKYKGLYPIDLQFFAEGEEASGTDVTGTIVEGEAGANDPKPVIFDTQSELDSFVDKRIGKALNTAKETWKSESQKAIEDAEKKGKMSAEEQAQYDLDKEKESLAKERLELQRDRNETDTIKKLASDKLPDSLSEVFSPLYGDKNSLDTAYDSVIKAFRQSVETTVNSRLASSVDIPGSESGGGKTSAAEQYAKELNEKSKIESNLWKTN